MDCGRIFYVVVLGKRESHWKWENRLRDNCAQITYCDAPQEACDYLAQHSVDLILVDSQAVTPQAELAICTQIHGQSNVPILLLTHFSDEDHLVTAYEGGINDHLVQPASSLIILAKLLAWLRWAESPNSSTSGRYKTILKQSS
jgi:DNA-binding response OmpR family regulator